MQENTPSQAEGERPEEEPGGDGPRDRDEQPERTTPSQAEGERDPEDDTDV
ncbi:hypothetical protein [Streptomyces sp. NPDC047097]|uniref:hypothetical protein n=1 Tax=Streptomyces sp. NPDC047097 TaxID=3155260 RepID=UPI00340A4CC0